MANPAFQVLRNVAVVAGLACFEPNRTHAAQIDCEVILCLAGSFSPAECAPAHSYMMSRIKRVPPKPPFGECKTASSDGTTTTYRDAQARLTSSKGPATCVAVAPPNRDNNGGWCIRQCYDLHSNVDLTIHNVGGSGPFRSTYTYASVQKCVALDRWGREITDGGDR